MITRPLELSSRLRAEPRNFDALFYVNIGLIALFFGLFGSRFVLEPGLGADFELPVLAAAGQGAIGTTSHISVLRSGQIFTDAGLLGMAALPDWFAAEAKKSPRPALLIRASANVAVSDVTAIVAMARRAGFVSVVLAAEERPGGGEPVK